MKPYPAVLSLGVAFALVCAQAQASVETTTSARAKKSSQLSSEMNASTPGAFANVSSPEARHVFPVMDEKGLLLTCIAPEMETNKDTDLFKNCALAPGRTLDDVMHSFVKAVHQQQREVEAEKAPSREHTDDKAETNRDQK